VSLTVFYYFFLIFKKQLFYKTLVENGIKLEEPEFKDGLSSRPGLDYENENFFNDCRKIPFPPHLNNQKKKLLREAEEALLEKNKE
jgi:hypothetical protein